MTPDEETQIERWMRQAQGGDQLAYAELLARLTAVARRFVRGRAGAVPWLEDALQETRP